MSKTWTITEEDFNRCIGSWLNADNSNYQTYVQGIKLFRDYLDKLVENAEQVTTAVSTEPNNTTKPSGNA